MPEIKYVCLSDLHLGADTSILTGLKNDRPIDDQLSDNVAPGTSKVVNKNICKWLK